MHWIAHIEAEYDQPIYDLLVACRDQARHTGTSLPLLAEEFGVTRHQLSHLCRKLGIHWPKHVSAHLAENARAMGKANARYVVTLDGITDSIHAHARRLGVCFETARRRAEQEQARRFVASHMTEQSGFRRTA